MNTKTLLTSGIAAGPIFVIVVAVQLLTRDGFDIAHHPISLLSVGDAGWIQITNFVVAGVLSCLFAWGLRRVLAEGRGRVWLPRLLAIYGAGLVAGGVFAPDPALGYPAGTPDAVPDSFTWHATLHAFAPPLAFITLVVATGVAARRFHGSGRRGWAAYSVATGAVATLLTAWPDQDTMSWRLALGVVVGFAWVSAVAVRERVALGASPRPTAALARRA